LTQETGQSSNSSQPLEIQSSNEEAEAINYSQPSQASGLFQENFQRFCLQMSQDSPTSNESLDLIESSLVDLDLINTAKDVATSLEGEEDGANNEEHENTDSLNLPEPDKELTGWDLIEWKQEQLLQMWTKAVETCDFRTGYFPE
jgi:hypothetical protein